MIDELAIDALADAVQRVLRPHAMPYPDEYAFEESYWQCRRRGYTDCVRQRRLLSYLLQPALRYHASRPSAPRYAR